MKKSKFVVLCIICKEELGIFEDVPRELNYIQVNPCKKCAAQQMRPLDGASINTVEDNCPHCGYAINFEVRVLPPRK